MVFENECGLSARYLKRYVDAWREGVHDVVTQYTTIFLDRPQSAEPHAAASDMHVLLTTFTTLQVRRLLAILQETLPLVADPSLLTSLLTQLTYCATSFARVGMDFRGALAPLFVSAVRKGVTREFDNATDAWCRAIDLEDVSKARSRGTPTRKKPSQFLLTPSAASSPPTPTEAQISAIASAPANTPPSMLVSYPPLAIYTNALLTALNGLRLLAPADLLPDLLLALERSLAHGAIMLLVCARSTADERANGSSNAEDAKREEDVTRAAGAMFVRVFVPFVRRALVEGVYGVQYDEAGLEVGEDLAGVLKEWEDWLAASGE